MLSENLYICLKYLIWSRLSAHVNATVNILAISASNFSGFQHQVRGPLTLNNYKVSEKSGLADFLVKSLTIAQK